MPRPNSVCGRTGPTGQTGTFHLDKPAAGTRQRGPFSKHGKELGNGWGGGCRHRGWSSASLTGLQRDSSPVYDCRGLRPRLRTRIKTETCWRGAYGNEKPATQTNCTRSGRNRGTAFMNNFLLSVSVSMSVKWGHDQPLSMR